ncbi:lipoprotein NlpD [Pokkaliibacter plantistimulans]|uniref:Lipoprotein NlpD n=1 Tax=Proteobacteria bacterium 228 TaxID=2083153 RepID=A0A2S5KHY9_9PROT|nr:LysM peptidoglycan-binding domain-containing M23 family metallopeptidase [Pokkaliibacter plantistimulans]PPC74390.1 lipoprotein NlpD [Pokkaliibacter plantistimulans]
MSLLSTLKAPRSLRLALPLLILALLLGGCGSNPPLPSETQTYYVKAGDTFYSIARRYGISVKTLSRLNPDANPSRIEIGDKLKVPTDAVVRHFAYPVSHPDYSSGFGMRDGRMHNGVDFRGPSGTSVLAAGQGKVVFSGNMRGYGRIIIIDHGGGFQTVYAHNSVNLVDKGETVQQGQPVARMGNSGHANGTHVHFEVRIHGQAVNPMSYLR